MKKYKQPKTNAEADDILDNWHAGKYGDIQVYDAMGMTQKEYFDWVQHRVLPCEVRASILERRIMIPINVVAMPFYWIVALACTLIVTTFATTIQFFTNQWNWRKQDWFWRNPW